MKLNDAFPGKTFKKDSPEFANGAGLVLEIAYCEMEEFQETSGQTKRKLSIHFTGEERRLICNVTNFTLITAVTGQEDSDNWPGQKIELFADMTVRDPRGGFGGVRVRKPTEPKPGEMADEDSIPF